MEIHSFLNIAYSLLSRHLITLLNFNMRFFVTCFFVAITLISCEKVIPFDGEVSQPKLVVNSLFDAENAWNVHISRSISVLEDSALSVVENATKARLSELLKSKKALKGNGFKKGEILSIDKLSELNINDIFSIRTDNENVNKTIEETETSYKQYIKDIKTRYEEKKEKIKRVDKWFAIDKLQHFSYSCLISLGCQYVLVNKKDISESDALHISTVLSFSAGLSKELNDRRGKNGFFSVKDMIANCAGLFVAIKIINY